MNIIEIVKIILPFFAIVISIAAVFISHQNVKKQIRVSKLEEILEIINMLKGYYKTAFLYTNDLKNNERYLDGKLNTRDWMIIESNLNDFLSNIREETIQQKTARLYVLTNSYLPKSDLKFKTISVNELFCDVFYTLFYKRLSKLKDKYNGNFPKPEKVFQIIDEIESAVVKEMNLGFETITYKDYKAYFENTFKNDSEV